MTVLLSRKNTGSVTKFSIRRQCEQAPVQLKALILNEPALLERGFDEAGEERVRLERPALELRVKLNPDEPGVIRPLDDLGQLPVGGHAREQQAGALQLVLVVDVDLVAVAMPLADVVAAVDRVNDAVSGELRRIGAEPHRSAEVAAGGALLQPLLAHPLGDEADDRLRSLAELGR